ncbi:hypothetical protein JQR85_17570 [Stutzerimonas urumqiensis]|uniref:hypothetical protein n=1 Tax=Stutzerimonas urumqiensis TaxID=638269 RepID=UPI003DA5BD4E
MTALLPLALMLELLALITHLEFLSVGSGLLLVLFFVRHWASLMPYPRRLGWVTLVALGIWIANGEAGWSEARRVLSSAAYYGAFIAALGLMHCLVKRLERIGELHRLLLAGPRPLLYPYYVLSSFAISSILSFGMLNLICGSLGNHLGSRSFNDEQRREGQRGVMVAALRGFALVPLLAPTSVTVAILTREFPSLGWTALLPFGALSAVVLLLIGWPQETRRLVRLRSDAPSEPSRPTALLGLLGGSLVGIGLIAAMAYFTWLSATQAAMVLVPLVVIAFLARRERPAGVYGEVTDTLVGMRNEVFIFAASGLLGGVVADLVPVALLAEHFSATPLAVFLLGAFGMLTIIGLALLGVAPIITLNLCAATLAQLATHGVPVMQPAVALLGGFSLAMLLSPYGPSALLLARHAQLSPWRIAYHWNGRFVLIALPLLLAITLLA